MPSTLEPGTAQTTSITFAVISTIPPLPTAVESLHCLHHTVTIMTRLDCGVWHSHQLVRCGVIANLTTCIKTSVLQYTNGDVRLVGRVSKFEGNIEYCCQGVWFPICSSIGDREATVACRQLGFLNLLVRIQPQAVVFKMIFCLVLHQSVLILEGAHFNYC